MRQLKLIFCLLLSAVAPSVKAAEVCRDIIGEDQSVEVAAGKTARVMFFLRGPEAGYIEICKIHGQKTELVFAAAAEASGWYQAVDLPAETAKFQRKELLSMDCRAHSAFVDRRKKEFYPRWLHV